MKPRNSEVDVWGDEKCVCVKTEVEVRMRRSRAGGRDLVVLRQ